MVILNRHGQASGAATAGEHGTRLPVDRYNGFRIIELKQQGHIHATTTPDQPEGVKLGNGAKCGCESELPAISKLNSTPSKGIWRKNGISIRVLLK